MCQQLEKICTKPSVFDHYTAKELWNDPHTSQKMLEFHLNEAIDVSSRKRAFINESVEWILKRFSEAKTYSDFGCGPGLYTHALAKKEKEVTGIDFSSRSIAYAKQKALEEGLSITYVEGDYLLFESEKRYDLITMIMCDFSVLSPLQREKLLKKWYDLLSPGGHILLDVYGLEMFESRREESRCEKNHFDGFWSQEEYYALIQSYKYEEKVLLDKYTIITPNETKTIYNWLQCYSVESLRLEFEKAGFKIVEVYKNVAGHTYDASHSEFAVVAVKV